MLSMEASERGRENEKTRSEATIIIATLRRFASHRSLSVPFSFLHLTLFTKNNRYAKLNKYSRYSQRIFALRNPPGVNREDEYWQKSAKGFWSGS